MAPARTKKLKLDLRPAIEYIGVKEFVAQVVAVFGIERVIVACFKQLGVEAFLAKLSPAQRRMLRRLLAERN